MKETANLDETTITYSYDDLGTVQLEFYNGQLKYEWLEGAFAGMKREGFKYQSKKIGDQLYMVQWLQKPDTSLITLIINFKTNEIQSSALLNPKTEEEAVLFHEATIKKQHLVVN